MVSSYIVKLVLVGVSGKQRPINCPPNSCGISVHYGGVALFSSLDECYMILFTGTSSSFAEEIVLGVRRKVKSRKEIRRLFVIHGS